MRSLLNLIYFQDIHNNKYITFYDDWKKQYDKFLNTPNTSKDIRFKEFRNANYDNENLKQFEKIKLNLDKIEEEFKEYDNMKNNIQHLNQIIKEQNTKINIILILIIIISLLRLIYFIYYYQ